MKIKPNKFNVFITQKCKKTIAIIKVKLKRINSKPAEIFYVGDNHSLMELLRFEPDMIITNYQNNEIYIRDGESLKRVFSLN